MDKGVIMQMQHDRLIGNIQKTSAEARAAELRNMGAANWVNPPLPPSPCLRVKATGEIIEWSPSFAERSDLCENCDEHGNTDPSTWQGRTSPHFEDNLSGDLRKVWANEPVKPNPPVSEPVKEKVEVKKPILNIPPGVHFTFDEFLDGSDPNMVAPMDTARSVYGIQNDYAQSYTNTQGMKRAAMPFDQSNVPVSDAVQQMFHNPTIR